MTTVETKTNEVLFENHKFVAARPGQPGVQLLAHQWHPAHQATQACVVIVHGYMEHAGRYRKLAHHFAQAGFSTLCADLRGHGGSKGQRGYVAHFDDYLDDLDGTLRAFGQKPIFILGHSLGGLIALDYVSRRKPEIAGLIVTNPYLSLAKPLSSFQRFAAHYAGRWFPRLSLPSGLAPEDLTHDQELIKKNRNDPNIFSYANAAWMRESSEAQKRVLALREFPSPLLYIYSDADPIAAPTASQRLSAQLQAQDKTIELRLGELHEVLNEIQRYALYDQITAWISKRATRQD